MLVALWVSWGLGSPDHVHYTPCRSGDLEMLCWVYVADGVRAGRCAVLAATAWAPSIEERSEVVGVMVLPSLVIKALLRQ